MKPLRNTLPTLGATVAVILTASVAMGCHISRQVQYINESSGIVTLWIDGVRIDDIGPGETEKVSHREEKGDTDRIEVYAQDGTKLLDRTYTWEDFEAEDFKIVIRDPGAN